MAAHKSAIPLVEKEVNIAVTQHPWSKMVKDYLSQKIKYAHNSIKNPQYPEKFSAKKKIQPDSKGSDSDRVQFTVIGDRVTKEFIFCCNMVRGLHKYRWKNFDAPVIRSVSTLEWPSVWNDLKIRFGTVAICLLTSVAVFVNDQLIGGEKELKQLVEQKYVYHLCLDYCNEGVAEFTRFIKSSGRPTAYMHVSIGGAHIGTLIFMLYADIVPYTCENFLRLCKETKGGYGGTPVHRIVKDGWIQCGGFGLKSTPLSCENFIIPLDKRGVLAMANDGRDVDCSTQFFVLLQPAPWMNHKYVAFGQLIEGAATLEEIERVTTWYESPTSQIILYRCGILNTECQDIRISKGTNQYIDTHIEDLNEFSDRLWENILEQVFLAAQLREIERLREQGGEGAEYSPEDDAIRPTQRFKKEDIQKQIEKNQEDGRSTEADNKEFDVDEYDYESEEDDYKHQSIHPASLIVKPQKPYYIPLTDVPYPGDVQSDFDLQRLLQGKYCLKSDLAKHPDEKTNAARFPSDLFFLDSKSENSASDAETNTETEVDEELNAYIQDNVDRISFAGEVVKSIAKKGPVTLKLGDERLSTDSRIQGHINDEVLRKIRLASSDFREHEERVAGGRVAINAPASQKLAGQIKRRQTGFVRQQDLANIKMINDSDDDDDDDDDDDRNVRLNPVDVREAEETQSHASYLAKRRPTGFIRPSDFAKFIINYDDDDDDDDDSDVDDADDDDKLADDNKRTSIDPFRMRDTVCDEEYDDKKHTVLTRLFKQATNNDIPEPTLKNYKPIAEIEQQRNTLTYSTMTRLQSNESTRTKYTRAVKLKENTIDQILDLQHGKRITRKISSDYVKTIAKEQIHTNSLRSVEYARTRPTMSVFEYRKKNQKYQEGLQQMSNQVNTVMMPNADFDMRPSIDDVHYTRDNRGDTPDVMFPIK